MLFLYKLFRLAMCACKLCMPFFPFLGIQNPRTYTGCSNVYAGIIDDYQIVSSYQAATFDNHLSQTLYIVERKKSIPNFTYFCFHTHTSLSRRMTGYIPRRLYSLMPPQKADVAALWAI